MKYSSHCILMFCAALFALILMGFVVQPISARRPRPPIRPEEQSLSSAVHNSNRGSNNQRKKASGKHEDFLFMNALLILV